MLRVRPARPDADDVVRFLAALADAVDLPRAWLVRDVFPLDLRALEPRDARPELDDDREVVLFPLLRPDLDGMGPPLWSTDGLL